MELKAQDIIEKARIYAYKCHRDVNHWYDGKPYEYHLEMSFKEAEKYIYLIPNEFQIFVLIAVLCHDLFEDARQSYNDIKRNTNETVADIVYAVSDEKGKTREEKHNDKYYNGIRTISGALFVKLCDRLANSKHSLEQKSTMFNKYKKEYFDFKKQLYNESLKPMFDELDSLYNNN